MATNKRIWQFKVDENISVFVTCFFISFLFWIMIVLGKDYTAYINVKTNYTNLPEDKMLTYKLPAELKLEVSTAGFVLLSNAFFNKELQVNIDATPPKKNGGYAVGDEYVLQLQSQTSQMTEQLGNSYKIKSIYPDNINFYLATKAQKIVPIKYNIKYNFLSQFSFADSLHTLPNKVLIKGPQQLLDKIDFIDTDSITIKDISQNVTRVVHFKITDELKQVQLKGTRGVIYIPVDKFTETELEVPIKVKTNNNLYTIKTFPAKTKVKFLVTLSKFKLVKESMFTVSAQATDIDLLHTNKLVLTIDKYPNYIKNPVLKPSEVEFILNPK